MPMDSTAPAPMAAGEPEDDYAALLSTLSESARGRAFLAEHARRTRQADTGMLLAAIERLEALVRGQVQAAAPASPEPASAPDAQANASDVQASAPDIDERPQARPASDPLAALKALTDDERLALFT
jgi:hypothetical protein